MINKKLNLLNYYRPNYFIYIALVFAKAFRLLYILIFNLNFNFDNFIIYIISNICFFIILNFVYISKNLYTVNQIKSRPKHSLLGLGITNLYIKDFCYLANALTSIKFI